MIVTVLLPDDQCMPIEVDTTTSITEILVLVEAELGNSNFKLIANGRDLPKSGTLADHGIVSDDVILVVPQKRLEQTDTRGEESNVERTLKDIDELRLRIVSDPHIRQEMEEKRPEVARAAQQDGDEFRRLMLDLQVSLGIITAGERDEIDRHMRVETNMLQAMEHHPEVFGSVTMLYVAVKVNGQEVKAFVDSGAQTTIISPETAQRCGLNELIDSRWSGIAQGVGTGRIIGRIHSADLQLGNLWLPCSFTVLEQSQSGAPEMLLGLDMLRRYQACIDLEANVLRVHGNSIPFLAESDIPKN